MPVERLQNLHAASLRLLNLLTVHKVEEELLQKSIASLAELIGARYGAIGILDEEGRLKQFVHTGIAPELAARIGRLPEGRGLLGVVIHENHALRLDDLSRDPRAVGFPPHHPPMKSLLAVPVSHEGKVYGRVYLSEKTNGAPFTDADEQLAAHLAESLALTLHLHRAEAERQRAEDALRDIAHAMATATGDAFFRTLVLDLAKVLDLDYVFVGEVSPHDPQIIHTLAFCDHGKIADNIEYQLVPETVCGSVECKAVCHFPEGARRLYPEDELLNEFLVEAFIGHPLLDAAGNVLGLLAVMHGRPLANHGQIQSILQICAARATVEIERRRSDRTMRESEERFRATFSQAAVGIAHVAPDGRWLRVNQKLCEIVGYTEQELLARTFQDITHPDDLEADLEHVRQVLAGAIRTYSMEKRYFRKDGSIVWIYLTVSLVRDGQNNPKYFISVVEDISVRRQAEEALRRSEENLRALAENANDGILVNSGGRHVFANQRLADLLGYSLEELCQTSIKELVHPDEYEKVTGRFRARMAGEAVPSQYETVFMARNGAAIPVEINAAKTVWRGQPAGLVIVRDITERKRAEETLRAANEQLQMLIQSSPLAIYTRDLNGLLTSWNPAAEKMYGWKAAEVLGKPLPSVPDAARAESDGLRLRLLAGETYIRHEARRRRRDGSPIDIDAFIAPLRDASGKPSGIIAVVADITERKQAEQALRESEGRLHNVVENAPVCIHTIGLDGCVLSMNPAGLRMLGLEREEQVRGMEMLAAVAEADRARVRKLLREAMQGKSSQFEFTAVKGWLFSSCFIPVKDDAGNVEYILGVTEDVTERRRLESKRQQLASAIEQTADSVLITDREGVIEYVNQAYETATGWSRVEAIGRKPNLVKSGLHDEAFYRELWRTILDGRPFRAVLTNRRKDGELYYEEKTITPIRDASGRIAHFVSTGKDITERIGTERALRESEEHIRLLMDSTAEAIYGIDTRGYCTFANSACLHLLGYSDVSTLIGREMHDLIHHTRADGSRYPTEECRIYQAFREDRPAHADDEVLWRADGTSFPAEYWSYPIRRDGKVVGAVVTFLDISERRATEEQLNYLAYYDPLTGLPNRALLIDRLQQAMVKSDRVDRLVAVLFLDLDRFKVINDTLGHHLGDGLLKAVAERLKSCMRAGDTISRIGGDEFTVVLADVAHVDDVTRVVHKILDSFAQPFRVDDRDLFTAASIGITLFPFDVHDAEGLLKNADAAMYHAKESGRNTFRFFTADLNVRAERRLALENALRQAIAKNQLALHYQPQVDLKSGRIVGMEALARWTHPELGPVSPLEFIPVAEETGLILPIGEWVLRQACRQIVAWHETGFPKLQVAVNISGKQLLQQNFPKKVQAILRETGLAARYLDLELTESVLISDTETTAAATQALHALGVSFSIDDFGTGYSSLAYLKRFPIDILKIDRSFVRDLATDPNDVAIVKTIIAMAHTLGMRVVAEGVETHAQLEFLRGQDCDGSQGYYCSEPLDAGTFTELLHDWSRIRGKKCRLAKPAVARRKPRPARARGRRR